MAHQYARPKPDGSSTGRTLLFGFLGGLFGASIDQDAWGLFSGAALGLLLSSRTTLRRALEAQTARLSALEARLPAPGADAPLPAAAEPPQLASEPPLAETPSPAGPIAGTPPDPRLLDSEEAVGPDAPERAATTVPAPPPPAPPAPAGPTFFDRGLTALRSFFFGGNTVVRVGLLVLLVGLTLLAKYAADNALFPIEARLACVGLAGLALTTFGFRVRGSRPGFGLRLQGGGLASLYIVTFFAFKPYALVPSSLAFTIFVGLALATALLSVLQRAEPLILIGLLGGFLAPVLSSTGEGSHVALFGYYAVLVAAIAAVAARESWRWPGLVAFYATYGVATTWGVLRYEPELFATTQPFVIGGLVLFTGIAILHAWSRPPRLRGFIDGTLVFGTPIVSILYQRALVMDFELGLALSAAGFAVFYLACALLVRRSGPTEARPLADCFLALAVGFATMAIPFAFDEALTTAVAWALEGAGLYWIGARQARTLPRVSGLVLQLGAGLAFVASAAWDRIDPSAFLPIANGRAISCVAIAFAGFFIARTAWQRRDQRSFVELVATQALGLWALYWWSGGAIAEIQQFVGDDHVPAALVALVAATAIGLEWSAERSDWSIGRLYALLAMPAAAIALAGTLDVTRHILANGGWLAWPILFASLHFLWARQAALDRRFLVAFRTGSIWLLSLFAPLALAGATGVGFGLDNDWETAAFGAALAATLFAAVALHRREAMPFERASRSALGVGLGPTAALAALTILGLQVFGEGDASPLPHVPILNPVDVAVWCLALAIWSYARRAWTVLDFELDETQRGLLVAIPVVLGFASLNGVLARAVSQWTDVPYDGSALWDSVAMQMVLSIAWTVVGLVGMLLSSQRGWRQVWMVCAALLGVVVVKLFTVDLSQLSTVARIGTFLAVGVMLLVLGYFSPVPPGAESGDASDGPAPSPANTIGESA